MSITVKNSTAQNQLVTLFGELRDGRFVGKVMREDSVPYGHRWENEIDQVMVYIVPDDEQMAAIITALHERRLALSELQNYGSLEGGTSVLPI